MVDTEIWPNFLTIAEKKQIKTYLINARLSKKSLQKYQKFEKFSLKTMHKFKQIFTQDEYSNAHFKQLGVQNSTVIGNIKFDIVAKTHTKKLNEIKHIIQDRDFIVCSSTHAPEEELIIKSYKQHNIKELLVFIPRHPQRFREVEDLLIQHNINFIKQSDKTPCTDNTQIILANSMGFVLEYYSLCKFAFIGGSFSGTGGHNMLEALAFNKLCVFGTDTFNFKYVVDNLLKHNAGIQIESIEDLWDISRDFSNKKYQIIVQNATQFLQQNSGVSEKLFNMLSSKK